MIKAVIIDDEENNIANLEAILSENCPEVQVVGTATDPNHGLNSIEALQPDLLFLDIQMPGKNGFELLQSLKSRDFEVVFVTAYDHYGIQAIKFSALDYLLKPVDISELKEAVQKTIARSNWKKQNLRVENLMTLLENNRQKEDHRIALPSLAEVRFVRPEQIIRCESSNTYTLFHLHSGEQVLITKPIYEYEELLEGYGFIRCHQSHLVNKRYIKSFVKKYGGHLIMEDGAEIPVSRLKKNEIKKTLNL